MHVCVCGRAGVRARGRAGVRACGRGARRADADDGSLGVATEAEAVAEASAECNHVLERTAWGVECRGVSDFGRSPRPQRSLPWGQYWAVSGAAFSFGVRTAASSLAS